MSTDDARRSLRQKQRDRQDFDYMVHAVGFGVRYRTPVGPLRLDLGYSVNPPSFFDWNGDDAGDNMSSIIAGSNRCYEEDRHTTALRWELAGAHRGQGGAQDRNRPEPSHEESEKQRRRDHGPDKECRR